jgi:Cu-Zn family superoxide dismutase
MLDYIGGIAMFGGYYYSRDTVSPQVGPTPAPYTQQAPQMLYVENFNTAYAMIVAGPDYPSISGLVTFVDVPGGVRVCADVAGLPAYKPATADKQPVGPFGFHIHEKGNCDVGNPAKPFEASGGHWNPANQPHGIHAGDFPVLTAGNNRRAIMCFITDRFRVSDIVGRSVMIHENPDDYRTQPAGNSGKRIACGVIRPMNMYQQYMQ